jgi:predicted nucleotidyltransferase
MPEPSSMPAGSCFLDREAAICSLRALAKSLVDSRESVVAVYLFGSLAQGRHVPGSDADLLIVLHGDERRMMDRIPDFLRAFIHAPLPADVVPFTEREITDRKTTGDPFICRALDEGILLSSHTKAESAAQLGAVRAN